jgi:hypothetical protein
MARVKRIAMALLRNDFERLVDRVANEREYFVVEENGRPVMELRPVERGVRLCDLHEVMASLPRLDADEVDAFLADLEEARRERLEDIPNRWNV